MYLVVSCCVSQLVIVICVVIITLVNKSGIQSEPSSSYQSHYHLVYMTIYYSIVLVQYMNLHT
jgi:hypothetical protein